MNKAQQYINDYIECGWIHYQPAKTPMDMTGDFAKDRAFRKGLFEHCTNSQHWSKGSIGGRPVFHNENAMNGYGIIIDFNTGSAGGIAHNY